MAKNAQKYKEMTEVLNATWATWQTWFTEAKTDLEYYLGKQWTADEKKYLEKKKRPPIVINKLRRFLHLLSGYQRQHRLAISYKPVGGSDSMIAEQMTHLMLNALESGKMSGYNQISTAFSADNKVGLDWIELYIDYSDDPLNGDIKFKRVGWPKIMIDPMFQQLDLSDAGYLIRRERLTKKQLKKFAEGSGHKIKDFMPSNSGSYYPILDPSGNYYPKSDIYELTEYWQQNRKKVNVLLDIQSGEMREIADAKDERLNFILNQFPQFRLIKKYTQVPRLELYIGDDLFYEGDDPSGIGDYPYTPLFCYFDAEYDEMALKLQGIVRSLRDPSKELNKRRSTILHVLNTMALSGWKYEEEALTDEKQIYSASGPAALLKVRTGKMDRVQPIERQRFPTELIKVEEMFAEDMVDISGINAELLAMLEKDTPGISIQLRQRQGLVMIQEPFDNLVIAKKGIGKKYAKAVQSNYSPQKIMRILEDMPAPAFYTGDFGKLDAIVDEAINSPTQRDYTFQKLAWFHQNVAPVHPLVMLEMSDFPEKHKDAQAQFMLSQLDGMAAPPQGRTPIPGGGSSYTSTGAPILPAGA
jgi:hypothetical protein